MFPLWQEKLHLFSKIIPIISGDKRHKENAFFVSKVPRCTANENIDIFERAALFIMYSNAARKRG